MPTSAAFFVNGRSGNTRVQIFAVFPAARVSARRAASSWLEVTRACVVALRPNAPNATVVPRVSGCTRRAPRRRPVCHLRCFVFLGDNIWIQLCARRAGLPFLVLEDIAAIDPDFDADDAVREVCGLAGEVDVGTDGLERDAAALDLLLAGHLCAAEAAGNGDAHALHVAVRHHLLHGLL